MDLMFDSMPLIYDMIDDDMRLIAMRYSSNDSSCLSDEEQLALSSCCSNLLDDFYFSSPTSSLNSSLSSSCTQSYNNSTSSSGISSASASPTCELSPILQSPISTSPTHTMQTTSQMQSSSIYDDINTYSISKFNTTQQQQQQQQQPNHIQQQQQHQDQSSMSAYQTYQTINPSDLNLNYQNILSLNNNTSHHHQHHPQHQQYVADDHALYHKQVNPTNRSLNKLTTTNVSPISCKRIKYSTDHMQQQPQQQFCNSDGESISSNESNDSNSNLSSPISTSTFSSTPSSAAHSPPIQTIQIIDSTSFLTNTNTNSNINVIKLNNKDLVSTTTATATTANGNGNSTNGSDVNNKHIIHYKQLINKNNLLTTANATGLTTTTTTAPVSATALLGDSNCNRSEKVFPKPPFSYSCLIAMALRNSDSGTLPVSDIYEFIIENFPYYKTARDGWKNSIRHNLSLNKCFEKIENPVNGSKKGCLWALNPDKCKKLEEECKRCRQRDLINIRLSMSRPDELSKIERGEQRIKKMQINQNQRKIMDSTIQHQQIHQQQQQQQQQNSTSSIFNTSNHHTINLTNNLTTITPTTICINKNVNSTTNNTTIIDNDKNNNNSSNSSSNNSNNKNLNTNQIINNNENKYLISWTNAKPMPITNTITTVTTTANDKSYENDQCDEFYIKLECSDDQYESMILTTSTNQSINAQNLHQNKPYI